MSSKTGAEVWTDITAVVTDMLSERGEVAGPMSNATKINADLGISSVEAIHLMILLEDKVGVPLSFQDLAVRDGEYATDLTLGEMHVFVCGVLGVAPSTTGS